MAAELKVMPDEFAAKMADVTLKAVRGRTKKSKSLPSAMEDAGSDASSALAVSRGLTSLCEHEAIVIDPTGEMGRLDCGYFSGTFTRMPDGRFVINAVDVRPTHIDSVVPAVAFSSPRRAESEIS